MTTKTDTLITVILYIESGCNFSDGEFFLHYDSHEGFFDMMHHPDLLFDTAQQMEGGRFETEVSYELKMRLCWEWDGYPQMAHYFVVENIERVTA